MQDTPKHDAVLGLVLGRWTSSTQTATRKHFRRPGARITSNAPWAWCRLRPASEPRQTISSSPILAMDILPFHSQVFLRASSATLQAMCWSTPACGIWFWRRWCANNDPGTLLHLSTSLLRRQRRPTQFPAGGSATGCVRQPCSLAAVGAPGFFSESLSRKRDGRSGRFG